MSKAKKRAQRRQGTPRPGRATGGERLEAGGKESPGNRPAGVRAPDLAAAVLVVAFAMAMVARPLPNLDLWWLLAVGRRIVETGAYIYRDPFTFTVTGTPWSPQAYASGILFYLLLKMGGMGAITVLRVLLVGAVAALTLRTLRKVGAAWAIAAPLVVVALVNAHSRFTDRGQIFEYVFLAWLVGFLLTCHERRGRSFLVAPLVVQLAWVQLHSSFLLGPVLTAIFFASEWIASHMRILRPLHRHDWRRAATLVALMALVCLVNPNPKAFLIQPFDPVQRELLTRFTLEWKSPFDPAMATGNFHPCYEVLLALAAAAVLLRLSKLPLAPAAMMLATAMLSFQSHRFRVEFALVAVPMIALLLRDAPLVALARRAWPSRVVWAVMGIAVALAIMVGERDRILKSADVPALYPHAALAFVAEHDVAKRPFQSIGIGSLLLWDLYGKRQSFIDGRNFDAALYQEFLEAQTRETSWRATIRQHKIDAFILPPPERADGGVRNLHLWLTKAGTEWPLVYADDAAMVYVAAAKVDSTWLAAHRIDR